MRYLQCSQARQSFDHPSTLGVTVWTAVLAHVVRMWNHDAIALCLMVQIQLLQQRV